MKQQQGGQIASALGSIAASTEMQTSFIWAHFKDVIDCKGLDRSLWGHTEMEMFHCKSQKTISLS